jgi:hypothetical protein
MGMGRAFRIDLEEVFVKADVVYQNRQRPYISIRKRK